MTGEWWWEPLGLDEAVALMRGFPAPWWIAGGWAIDLFLGEVTRDHSDVDIVVPRSAQADLRRQFAAWDVQVAHAGELAAWTEPLLPPRSGFWARRNPDGPWELQFLLATTHGREWVYRHDEAIRFPVDDVIERGRDGIPYLRPDLVLLNKSRRPRERDEADFARVRPLLSDGDVARLRRWLPADHAWRARL